MTEHKNDNQTEEVQDEQVEASPFSHKKMNECTLGARLRTLREVEELSRQEVAEQSHVREEYVAALEEGRFDDLPAAVYVRGFLRAMARALSARPEQLVALYDRELGIKTNVSKRQNVQQEESSATGPKARKIHLYAALFTPKQFIAIVSGVFVIAAVVYLYVVLRSFVGAPLLVIFTPESGAHVEMSEVRLEGKTDPSAVLTVGDAEVIVGQDGSFMTDVFLREGVNEVIVRATNRFEKTTQETVNVQYVNPRPLPVATAPDVAPSSVQLVVRIDDARTWLDISVDGEAVLTQTVDAGFEQTFEGEEIVVTSGGGSRTMVSRDGGEFAPLSEEAGLARDVRFALEGAADSTQSDAREASAPEQETVVE